MDDTETALNCINAAKSEIEMGNFERAITFLERAQRLHSPFAKENSEASKLIRQCNQKLKDPSVNNSSKKKEENTFEGAKRESFGSAPAKSKKRQEQQQEAPTSPSSSSNSEPSTPSSPSNEPKEGIDFTKEDADACKSILKLKDYYQILGVQKSASEDEIKKAYKKLAVKFHPDRNKAPQASDAFKSVSAAYMCLSNPEKKRMYDQYGTEDLASRMGSSRGASGFNGGFYGPEHMSEEDVFNIFAQMFGGDFMAHPRQRRGRGAQQQRFRFQQFHEDDDDGRANGGRQQGLNLGVLFQLLPLLLIVVFSLFAQFSSMGNSTQQEEIFSFVKTPSYSVTRSCQYGGIKYYVKPEFERQYSRYPSVINQVDSSVYSKYRTHLTEECRLEKKRRDQMSRQVAVEKDENKKQKMQERLDKYTMNKCDELEKMYGSAF